MHFFKGGSANVVHFLDAKAGCASRGGATELCIIGGVLAFSIFFFGLFAGELCRNFLLWPFCRGMSHVCLSTVVVYKIKISKNHSSKYCIQFF